MDFKDWAPLRFVDPEVLSRVRLAYVYGSSGQEAFIVTDEDEVLECGLGLENEEGQVEPVIFPELRKKKVKGFAATVVTGGSLVCAYTYSGAVYYWCENFAPLPTTVRPTMFPDFSKKVMRVVCGSHHCSILSIDGEVFCFGKNNFGQLGNGSTNSLSTPTLVQGDLMGKIVIKISCGAYFSVCVVDNGEVYAWGSNNCGQLGWSSQSYSSLSNPTKVPDISDVMVRKIICGQSHVLAINDVCELYSWGQNGVGSLGLGDNVSRHKPTKIKTIGKVISIAALKESSISVAVTENFEVYLWGGCGFNVLLPIKTPFESSYEVLAYYSKPRLMHKAMINRNLRSQSVGDSIQYSFGNPEHSDLTIVAEGKEIFVHKVILKLRSPYFKLLLQEPWVKEDDKSIEINQNYDGIYAYLQYIYTGNLKATPEVALESLKIADEYNDLVLKKICEKSIRRGMTVENVAILFSWAFKLDAKKLTQYCVSFASHHMDEVIKTPGFAEWDKETHKGFIVECQKLKLFRFSL